MTPTLCMQQLCFCLMFQRFGRSCVSSDVNVYYSRSFSVVMMVLAVPEGYSVYEGFMAVSILGYTLLTGACVVGMHLAYKQAILCDTDRIIQARGDTT